MDSKQDAHEFLEKLAKEMMSDRQRDDPEDKQDTNQEEETNNFPEEVAKEMRKNRDYPVVGQFPPKKGYVCFGCGQLGGVLGAHWMEQCPYSIG